MRYTGMSSGFCPLILKTDIDLAQEFAYTTDCSSKSIYYSVEVFMFNPDPSTYTAHK